MRAEEYLPWALSFIESRRVVAVEINPETGEYKALCENGSSYFLERLEQAQALLEALKRIQAGPG
ncbi:hypothetical protein DV704_08085 [Meiothermus sp. QL-1]|uniref:hypothetical protein n=1 Tax=Meiothermus sp. QL-1 TaxID=2058095 RepID=UPI000E0A165F|nr:hypothetical protein [Meiothermus sp. QL-1]RDI95258.1 hypothetical protein DV704_08085 [Meiothermus sp. QL-1]